MINNAASSGETWVLNKTLSNTTIEWLNTVAPHSGKFVEMLDSGLAIRNNYNSEDLKIIIESWLLKICRL